MKNFAPILCAALLAAPALADDMTPSVYVQATGGYAIGSISNASNIVTGNGFGGDFGNSATYGGGVGLKFPKIGILTVRTDLTGSFDPSLGGSNHTGSLPDGTSVSAKVKLQASTYLANIYGDLDVGSPFMPFVGMGIGGAHKRVSTIIFSNPAGSFASVNGNTHEGFVWSATVGGNYNVTENIALELAYRYTEAGRVNSGSNFTDLTQSPAVTQGLNQQISSDLNLHQFTATVRYLF